MAKLLPKIDYNIVWNLPSSLQTMGRSTSDVVERIVRGAMDDVIPYALRSEGGRVSLTIVVQRVSKKPLKTSKK